MSNEIDELEDAHDELEERIRNVEIRSASLHSTIRSMSTDIAELKGMFQRFFAESAKITELSSKMDEVPKIKSELKEVTEKYSALHDRLLVLEHTHTICSANREGERQWMKDIGDKIGKIDGERLVKIEQSIDGLKEEKNKYSGIWGDVIKTVITIIVVYFLYMIAMNIQIGNNPVMNPPEIKKSSLTTNVAYADTFSNQTTLKR